MPLDGSTYQTSPDVFSLDGLIAWLRTQDPETEYDWMSCTDCLVLRYLTARCGGDVPMAQIKYLALISRWGDEWSVAIDPPRTYGAALQRALELAARHKGV